MEDTMKRCTERDMSVPPEAAVARQKPLKEAIVGTWTLTSVYDRYEDGTKSEPWGRGVTGHYVFGSDGSYTQVIIGDARPDMESDDPRRPDGFVMARLGRYTVDEAKRTVSIKVERAANSSRNAAIITQRFSINGDTASVVGSVRKDKYGAFFPHSELRRFK
jgi:hypothetical protein